MKKQRKFKELNSFQDFSSKETLQGTPKNCLSEQIINELQKNEKLRIQLLRAHQTIKQLQDSSLSNIRNNEFSFNHEGLEAGVLWKENYNSLTNYIGEYMKDASFLAQKCVQLQNKCSEYEEQNTFLEKKRNKQIKEQKDLLCEMETKMGFKMKETQEIIESLIRKNSIKDKTISELEKQLKVADQVQCSQKRENERLYFEKLSDIENLKGTLTTVLKEKEELILKTHEFQNLFHEKQLRIEQFQRKYLDVEKANRELKKQLQHLFAQKQSMKRIFDEEKRAYDNMIFSLREKIQIQQRQYNIHVNQLFSIQNQSVVHNQEINNILREKQTQIAQLKNYIADLEIRINQKQWQIDELEEIKEMDERKNLDRQQLQNRIEQKIHNLQLHNHELSQKNIQLISDIETIIEQLKIRELEIEKYEKEKEEWQFRKNIEGPFQDSQKILKTLEGCRSIENLPSYDGVKEKSGKLPKFNLGAFQKKNIYSRFGVYQSNRKIR